MENLEIWEMFLEIFQEISHISYISGLHAREGKKNTRVQKVVQMHDHEQEIRHHGKNTT